MSSMLVDGHGNFGSLDADPPAAMRYTECRLRSVAEAMLLADIAVGLYKLNPADPELESAWLQPLSLPLDPS
jgi:DNA gyrase subunit A